MEIHEILLALPRDLWGLGDRGVAVGVDRNYCMCFIRAIRRDGLLRRAREEAGMTMRQLADAAGVSANTISLIEASRSAPRADVLKALAEALGTSMDAIWS